MKTFLCAVSGRFPENYQIGIHAQRWGVNRRYEGRIKKVSVGDELVFMTQEIRSIHRIESEVYEDESPLWPTMDGDIFPFRIKISRPLYTGHLSSNEFVPNIGFMSAVNVWTGTIQGPNGVFNDRLTPKDIAYIKSKLTKVPEPAEQSLRVAEEPKIQNLFRLIGSDVLESLKRILPSIGLVRYNGIDFPAEYDLGYGGNVVLCKNVQTSDFVVVDFNRGEAPTETLVRVLHYMSWIRQKLAGSKDVRGIILAETANEALTAIVREVPNVSLRFYRIGIEFLDSSSAA